MHIILYLLCLTNLVIAKNNLQYNRFKYFPFTQKHFPTTPMEIMVEQLNLVAEISHNIKANETITENNNNLEKI